MRPLKIDGFDKAIIGMANVWQKNMKVETLVYDGNVIIEILMSRDGIDEEEAAEFVSFNIEGAYMGKSTPIIVWDLP